MLLGHLHLDHTQGLGFFAAADDGQVDLYLPAQGDPAEVLSRVIGPPFFPLHRANSVGSGPSAPSNRESDRSRVGRCWPSTSPTGAAARSAACGLAIKAGAERLALFHHDPDRTDDQIDALVAELRTRSLEVFAAADGQSLDVRGLDPGGPASSAEEGGAER